MRSRASSGSGQKYTGHESTVVTHNICTLELVQLCRVVRTTEYDQCSFSHFFDFETIMVCPLQNPLRQICVSFDVGFLPPVILAFWVHTRSRIKRLSFKSSSAKTWAWSIIRAAPPIFMSDRLVGSYSLLGRQALPASIPSDQCTTLPCLAFPPATQHKSGGIICLALGGSILLVFASWSPYPPPNYFPSPASPRKS